MNNVRADLAAIEKRVKSLVDQFESKEFAAYVEAVDRILKMRQYRKRGVTFGDIHRRLGCERRAWTPVALKLCGVEESWTILPTRYFKSARKPFVDDDPHTWGETNSNLYKDECVGFAGAY